jgi:hypothetical protein
MSNQVRSAALAAGPTDAERALRAAPLLIALALAPACARAIIYTTPETDRGRLAPALVEARAVVERYRLVVRSVDDPSKEGPLCSAPLFQVREDAAFVELAPGFYDIYADVSPTVAQTFSPSGVLVRGLVTVRAGQCYWPALVCQRQTDLDWEQTCHVILQPRTCSSPWFGRRVLMQSSEDC